MLEFFSPGWDNKDFFFFLKAFYDSSYLFKSTLEMGVWTTKVREMWMWLTMSLAWMMKVVDMMMMTMTKYAISGGEGDISAATDLHAGPSLKILAVLHYTRASPNSYVWHTNIFSIHQIKIREVYKMILPIFTTVLIIKTSKHWNIFMHITLNL